MTAGAQYQLANMVTKSPTRRPSFGPHPPGRRPQGTGRSACRADCHRHAGVACVLSNHPPKTTAGPAQGEQGTCAWTRTRRQRRQRHNTIATDIDAKAEHAETMRSYECCWAHGRLLGCRGVALLGPAGHNARAPRCTSRNASASRLCPCRGHGEACGAHDRQLPGPSVRGQHEEVCRRPPSETGRGMCSVWPPLHCDGAFGRESQQGKQDRALLRSPALGCSVWGQPTHPWTAADPPRCESARGPTIHRDHAKPTFLPCSPRAQGGLHQHPAACLKNLQCNRFGCEFQDWTQNKNN